MTRQTGVAVSNNFIGGLLTEAPFLGFPPNGCTETLNCEHTLTGSVNRRLGFDYEINHSTKTIDRSDKAINTYLWKDVSGDGNLSLLVLQVGDTLYFYDASSTDPLSSRALSDTVDISGFQTDDAPDVSTRECQFTSGNGKMYVVHPYCEAFSISFDANTKTFDTEEIKIYVRDFERLEDNLDIDERPTTSYSGMNVDHHYNLLNQGWTNANLQDWDTAETTMPSNADVMSYFKNTDEEFDTDEIDKQTPFIGNTPAANGHYILNVFDKNRSAASGLVVPSDTTNFQRSSCIAFYAGRLFYSGVNYEGLSSSIFFSQIIEDPSQVGLCYQKNDPTSDNTFDLLPSDGGVIVIQESGTILKILSIPGALIVFASNGVWSISGSTGLGFTANDYTVSKISSISALTSTSFVDVDGTPLWWNLEGIYRLSVNQTGGYVVESITNKTIKTFFQSIPPSEKRNARGYYNPVSNVVQWLYRSTESSELDEFYNFDRVLNLNTLSGSFYIWTIPETTYNVHGIIVLENRGGDVSLVDVTDNDEVVVTDNDSEDVQVWLIANSVVVPNFKYVISVDDEDFTFAETRSNSYTDWHEDAEDIEYDSTFTTGYAAEGKGLINFQNNYVVFYSGADSKYLMRGIWNFGNSGNSGQWTTTQIVDANDLNVVGRRLKVRGQGKVLQIQIKSLTGEPFDIKGWSAFVTSNASV